MKNLDAKGVSLVEMCFAMLIFAMIAQVLAMTLLVLARRTLQIEEKGYSAIKGQQMFNELQAAANRNPRYGGQILDSYNDGMRFNLILTTDRAVSSPDDPLSGNSKKNGHWRYLRLVQIGQANNGNYQARQVAIEVTKCEADGNTLVPGIILSTTVGTVTPGSPPTCFQTPRIYIPPNL
jgi:hypothetical protein